MKDFSIQSYMLRMLQEAGGVEDEDNQENLAIPNSPQQNVSNMASQGSDSGNLQGEQGQQNSPIQQSKKVAPVKSPFSPLIDAKIKNMSYQQTANGSEIKIYTYENRIPFVLTISPNDVKLQSPPNANGDGEVVVLK